MTFIWMWGVVANLFVSVIPSAVALYKMNTSDTAFMEKYKNRGILKNSIHFLKSIAKILIPIFNIVYAIHMVSNIGTYGIGGLKGYWKGKINDTDEKLESIRSSFKSIGRIIASPFKKSQKEETPVVEKTVEKKAPVVEPKVKQTEKIQPKVEAKKEIPSKTKKVDPYVALIEKLDNANRSNIPTEKLSTYYTEQYWKYRNQYEELKAKGQDVKDSVKMLTIFHDKYLEMLQIRKEQAVLNRK